MSLFNRIKVSLIAVCLLVTVLGFASNVQADRASAGAREVKDSQTVVLVASKADMDSAAKMWTKQALLDAKPMALPEVLDADTSVLDTGPVGEPGMVSGMAPSAEADAVAMADFPEEWKALSYDTNAPAIDEPFGTANVYTSYITNFYSYHHLYFPYKAVGKLYFSGGYCSASVISPNNIIVTAAHCVYNTDNNTWYTNWTFYPAYRNAVAPYGGFVWSSARVLTNWMNSASSSAGRRYDVALIKLANNAAARGVTYYTGWLGRAWNYGDVMNLTAMGYPSNINSGLYSYTCHAESFYGGSTEVIAMGCNMTFGSSGGPWIRVFYPFTGGASNYVTSVASGGNPSYPTFYGAKFTSSNIVVLCTASGC